MPQPPPGFVLDPPPQASSPAPKHPTPPPGFVIDNPAAVPRPPSGFVLDPQGPGDTSGNAEARSSIARLEQQGINLPPDRRAQLIQSNLAAHDHRQVRPDMPAAQIAATPMTGGMGGAFQDTLEQKVQASAQGMIGMGVGAIGVADPEAARQIQQNANVQLGTPHTIGNTLAQGAGAAIPGTAAALGSGGAALPVALGITSGVGRGRIDAAQARADGREVSGAQEAATAAGYAGIEGTTAGIGAGVMKGAGKLIEPAAAGIVQRAAIAAGINIPTDVATSIAGQIAQNYVAKQAVDPERKLTEGVRDAAISGVASGVAGTVGSVVGSGAFDEWWNTRGKPKQQQDEPVPPPTPKDETTDTGRREDPPRPTSDTDADYERRKQEYRERFRREQRERERSRGRQEQGSSPAETFGRFKLDPNKQYTEAEVKSAIRREWLRTHPDRGGSADEFNKVQQDADRIKAYYESKGYAPEPAQPQQEQQAPPPPPEGFVADEPSAPRGAVPEQAASDEAIQKPAADAPPAPPIEQPVAEVDPKRSPINHAGVRLLRTKDKGFVAADVNDKPIGPAHAKPRDAVLAFREWKKGQDTAHNETVPSQEGAGRTSPPAEQAPQRPGGKRIKATDRDPATLSAEEFHSAGFYIHSDLRSGTQETRDAILRDGFRRAMNTNAAPVMRPDDNGPIARKYGPKPGKDIYLIPPEGIEQGANGPRVREGWKPKPNQIVRMREGETLHQAIVRQSQEQQSFDQPAPAAPGGESQSAPPPAITPVTEPAPATQVEQRSTPDVAPTDPLSRAQRYTSASDTPPATETPDIPRSQQPPVKRIPGKFSREGIEQSLIQHYDETAAQADSEVAAQADADVSGITGNTRTFLRNPKTKTGYPQEVERFFESPEGQKARRAGMFKLTDDPSAAGGSDAMGQLGEDKYFADVTRRNEDTAAGKRSRALDFAKRSPDPEIRLKAAILENRPARSEQTKKETLPVAQQPTGTRFTHEGHEFEIVEDADGERILRDGEVFEDVPADAIGEMPVDKGSVKVAGEGDLPAVPAGDFAPEEPTPEPPKGFVLDKPEPALSTGTAAAGGKTGLFGQPDFDARPNAQESFGFKQDDDAARRERAKTYAPEIVRQQFDPTQLSDDKGQDTETGKMFGEGEAAPTEPPKAEPPAQAETPSMMDKEASAPDVSDLPIKVSPDDINYDLARRAHEGTSFVPERRGRQRQRDYVQHMRGVYDELAPLAKTDEQKALLASELERYRKGFVARYSAMLSAQSRVVSSMIAGPSRFPARQMEKRGDTADRRRKELLEWEKRAQAAMRKTVAPEAARSISSDQPDAINLLQKKIAEKEALQARMKAINAAHKKFLKDPASLDTSDLSDEEKAAVRNYKPAYSWEPHPYPPYAMQNNNKEIARLKGRAGKVETLQSQETAEATFEGGKIVDNVEANRLQIVFDGKPPEDVRKQLKSAGFRWAPSEGAWQRQRGEGAAAAAERITKGKLPPRRGSVNIEPLAAAGKLAGQLADETAGRLTRAYSEPFINAMRRMGGTAGQAFANKGIAMASRAKENHARDIAVIDAGRNAVRKLGGVSTWLHRIGDVSDGVGVRNVVSATEGDINAVPAAYRDAVQKFRAANLAIGKKAEGVVPGFKATGRFQRNFTEYGINLIVGPNNATKTRVIKWVAKKNNIPEQAVRDIFDGLADDAATGNFESVTKKINQEFSRQLKYFPTSVKDGGWQDITHASPDAYLARANRVTSSRMAYLKEFPDGTDAAKAQIRKAGGDTRALDNLVRAAHEMPSDVGIYSRLAPAGSITRKLMSVGQEVNSLYKSLLLTGAAPVNSLEIFLGSVPQSLGMRNAVKGAMRLIKGGAKYQSALESQGVVDRAMYDWAFDPTKPTRSLNRILRNAIGIGSFNRFLNELTEQHAAATADVVTEMAAAGKLTGWQADRVRVVAEAMGFGGSDAKKIVEGKAAQPLVDAFKRRAAVFLTGGNRVGVEASPFQASRGAGELLPFQSYGIKQVNQMAQYSGVFARAIKAGDTKKAMAAARLLSRFATGTTAQGVGQALFFAMLGGALGMSIFASEAEDEPKTFVAESFLNGLAGPFSMIYRFATGSSPGKDATKMLFPVSAAGEMWDLLNGTGTYRDHSPMERAVEFGKKRVGAGRIAWSIVAPWAMGEQYKEIETSERAFYRWKSDEIGHFSRNDDQPANDAFRMAMRRAVEGMKAGKPTDDVMRDVHEALGAKDGNAQSLRSSLLARRLLKQFTPDKNDTPQEIESKQKHLDSLKHRIGQKAFDVLVNRDAILEQWANTVKPPARRKL